MYICMQDVSKIVHKIFIVNINESFISYSLKQWLKYQSMNFIKIVIIDKRTFYNSRIKLQNWKQQRQIRAESKKGENHKFAYELYKKELHMIHKYLSTLPSTSARPVNYR